MFDTLLNWWSRGPNNSLTEIIMEAMEFQVGPDENYMPPNQSSSLGNDDQSTWGLAALTAAEIGFPQPKTINSSWIELATAVWESHNPRWDEGSCGGGMKWQIFTFNNGYNYKNSMSNNNFALLGARLARYTGNMTYLQESEKTIDWLRDIGLISEDGRFSFDGTDDTLNCSEINHIQWSINAGTLLATAAYAANLTEGGETWTNLGSSILQGTQDVFFKDDVMSEVACEPSGNCLVDQQPFKAVLARAMADYRDLGIAPESNEGLNRLLQTSAARASALCSGGESGTECGDNWVNDVPSNTGGMGQELAALSVLMANLPARTYGTANSSDGDSDSNSTVAATGGRRGGGGSTGGNSDTNGAGALDGQSMLVTAITAAVVGSALMLI